MKNVDGPVGIYEDIIRRKPNDPAWYQGVLYQDDMPFGVPSLWFMSWYDVSIGPNLALFNHVRQNGVDAETRGFGQAQMAVPVARAAAAGDVDGDLADAVVTDRSQRTSSTPTHVGFLRG